MLMKRFFAVMLCALIVLTGCSKKPADTVKEQAATLSVTESVWLYDRGFSQAAGRGEGLTFTGESQISSLKTLISQAGYAATEGTFDYGSGYLIEFRDKTGAVEDTFLILLDGSMCRDGLIYEGAAQQAVADWLAYQQ